MSRDSFRSFIADNFGDLPPPPETAGPGPKWSPPPLPAGVVGPPVPSGTKPDTLPAFKWANQIVPANIKKPDLIVQGLLHRGCKLILSGGSKSFKSWALMHLGVAIAHGLPWWGLPTRKGRVLFLNFELIDGFFEERMISLCRAVGCELPADFIYWNLRGYCYDLTLLVKVLVARIQQTGPLDLIVVDPLYKAYGDLDENSATDMNKLMNMVEALGTQLGAAVCFGAHFAKGNAAGRDVKDRASGSGVLGRDPDVILTMTRHRQEDAYVVESELRYLPRLSPFVVRWNFPLMQLDESLDPRQLYVPGQSDEPTQTGPNSFSETDVLDCLPMVGAMDTLWRKAVALRFGRAGEAYYAAKASLLGKKLVIKQNLKYYRANLDLKSQSNGTQGV